MLGRVTEEASLFDSDGVSQEALLLSVGCTFGLEANSLTTAVLQVAPRPQVGLSILEEQWDAEGEHHCYTDHYGNLCERIEIEAGATRIAYRAQVVVQSPSDVIVPDASETPPALLPDEALSFVLPSRFCVPDELGNEAWRLFGTLAPGWSRVQAVVDYVHEYLEYVPGASNSWTTSMDVHRAGQGVCRDFAHLGIAFCRALNIPARYVCGYIPDIDAPPRVEGMDFVAWFEAYLDGCWHTFDPRNNCPRVGRVVVGRGRDAVDVALLTSFGQLTLTSFEVCADLVAPPAQPSPPVSALSEPLPRPRG
jgi:transglutaminase-like putative cysteine protease